MTKPSPSNKTVDSPSSARGCVMTPMRLSSPRSSSSGAFAADTANDRVMTLCERAKLLEKLTAHVGADCIESGSEDFSWIQCCITANVAKYSVFVRGGSGLRKRSPTGWCHFVARAADPLEAR